MKNNKKPDWLKELIAACKGPVRIIDFDSPEVKKAVDECRREQQAILDRKKLDYRQLEARITI